MFNTSKIIRKLNNVNESYTLEYLENIANGIVDSDTQEILYSLIDSE